MQSTSFTFVALCLAYGAALEVTPTRTIAPGVHMPTINLGTCCGSKPSVGVKPWLAAGGVGIDTAFDYDDQPVIAEQIKGVPRNSLFVTTKVPGDGICGSLDSNISLSILREDLKQLQVDYVDLVLLHTPCELAKAPGNPDPAAANAAQYVGLQQALELGLTRAIGVSDYNALELAALLKAPTTKTVPAVNQCEMSINGTEIVMNGTVFEKGGHDDATIAFCRQHNITYEAWGTMKGCPFNDVQTAEIAKAHGMSVAQVCLRWVLQHGAVLATGTGADSATAAAYSMEDLAVYNGSFSLADEEMVYLSSIKPTSTNTRIR